MALKKVTLSALASSLVIATGLSLAADQTQEKTQDQTQYRSRMRDQIYGSQLMTEQERIEYRTKMRSLKTQQERDAYRLEHHKIMQERAKEKGITLPDEPIRRRGGMAPGGGMGPGGGMSPGGGMGPGGGMYQR